MNKDIKSISFLWKGERVVISADLTGMFPLPVSRITNGQINTKSLKQTAMNVVTHRIIKLGDPVLTLQDGDKIRVYQSGKSEYMITLAASLIEKHDLKFKLKQKLKTSKSYSTQIEFPWEDVGDWD